MQPLTFRPVNNIKMQNQSASLLASPNNTTRFSSTKNQNSEMTQLLETPVLTTQDGQTWTHLDVLKKLAQNTRQDAIRRFPGRMITLPLKVVACVAGDISLLGLSLCSQPTFFTPQPTRIERVLSMFKPGDSFLLSIPSMLTPGVEESKFVSLYQGVHPESKERLYQAINKLWQAKLLKNCRLDGAIRPTKLGYQMLAKA
jgi:hypothetical protein